MTNTEKQAQVMSKLKNGFTYDDFLKVLLETLTSVKAWETDFDIFNRG